MTTRDLRRVHRKGDVFRYVGGLPHESFTVEIVWVGRSVVSTEYTWHDGVVSPVCMYKNTFRALVKGAEVVTR